jgi:hypothetical protein
VDQHDGGGYGPERGEIASRGVTGSPPRMLLICRRGMGELGFLD